jgi:hypothetical protein
VAVLVICPAVGETPGGVKTMAFGVLKLALFRIIEKLRAKLEVQPLAYPSILEQQSSVAKPGPMNVSLPRFP